MADTSPGRMPGNAKQVAENAFLVVMFTSHEDKGLAGSEFRHGIVWR
jgi:hypothetical protein